MSKEKEITDKGLEKIKSVLSTILGKRQGIDEDDVRKQFKFFNRMINVERERFENQIVELLGDVEDNENPDVTNKLGHNGATSIIQKLTSDLIKELWHHVITTKCPHCKKNSPAVRKDGYTKVFVKPLQGR